MARRPHSIPARPWDWQPLVSAREWAILARGFAHTPELLGDLRVVLAQLSPGVRAALIGNLVRALADDMGPSDALWMSLAITGHELKLGSAIALGRLHALGDAAHQATVSPLPTPNVRTERKL